MDLLGEEMARVELLGQMGGSLPCLRDWREEKVSALRCSQSWWGRGEAGEAHTLPHPRAILLPPGLGQLEPQGREGQPVLGQALLQRGSKVSERGESVW